MIPFQTTLMLINVKVMETLKMFSTRPYFLYKRYLQFSVQVKNIPANITTLMDLHFVSFFTAFAMLTIPECLDTVHENTKYLILDA
jgi:hypothetical protein